MPSILKYISKGKYVNYNCKWSRMLDVQSELVTCRNLAYSYAIKNIGGKKFNRISSEKKIEKPFMHLIPNDDFLDDFFFQKYASYATYFNLSTLGSALYEVASDINDNDSYLLFTINHCMALRMEEKVDGSIVIYFYDPNDTLRQRKIIVEAIEYLKWLSVSELFDIEMRKEYFSDQFNSCCLLSLTTNSKRDMCRVRYLSRPSEDTLHLLLAFGHYGHPQISINFSQIAEDNLAGRNLQGTSGLFVAAQSQHIETVRSYLKDICSSKLSKTKKIDLISGKNETGVPILYFAALTGDLDIFACFINILAEESDLTDFDIRELLTATYRGRSCWENAKDYNNDDLFSDIKEIIFKSKLSHSLKQQLISDIDGKK